MGPSDQSSPQEVPIVSWSVPTGSRITLGTVRSGAHASDANGSSSRLEVHATPSGQLGGTGSLVAASLPVRSRLSCRSQRSYTCTKTFAIGLARPEGLFVVRNMVIMGALLLEISLEF